MTHPATGQYCVVVSKRSSYKAAQVSLADSGTAKIVSAGTTNASPCNPLIDSNHDVVPVYIVTNVGAAADGNFTIVVPAP